MDDNEALTATLSFKTASRYTGNSISTIKRRIADGTFPKPIQLSVRRKAFLRREVDEWLAARAAARR